MNNELQTMPFPASEYTACGSLLEDLRYLKGDCDGLEWLIIYEHRQLWLSYQDTMLYCKVVILNEAGRKLAEFGKQKIFAHCNLRDERETMLFCRGICLAIKKWDDAHPKKSSPPPGFDAGDCEEL